MWNFVSIYKSQFVLPAETKFRTQKCNTPNSPNYKFYNDTVNLLVELNRCQSQSKLPVRGGAGAAYLDLESSLHDALTTV